MRGMFGLWFNGLITKDNERMLPFVFSPAYAEIHYRFRYFFSLLKKREPEIIADVPYRIEKFAHLPVLVIIKDAHRFPITLLGAEIFIDGEKVFSQKFKRIIKNHFQEMIFEIPTDKQKTGLRRITVKCNYSVRGKKRTCINDNYRGTGKMPLSCYFADEPLPNEPEFVFGDLHSHSSFTEDQIEFGAGLSTMQRMAKAIGLQFFAVTDHAYDLDDLPDNYLKNDVRLSKWHKFLKSCRRLNAQTVGPVILYGEELSVGNSKGRNAHLLILNNPGFIEGKGDSGERWFRFKPDHQLFEMPALLSEQAVAIPAHSAEKVPLLQKWLLNRGEWHQADLQHTFFTLLQSINGGSENEINAGITQWVNLLLQGRRLTLVAGNDAHGNFARTRQIGIPFVTMSETDVHRFGVWRTGIWVGEAPAKKPEKILAALKQGQVMVTNGPFVCFEALSNGKTIPMGGLTKGVESVRLIFRSSKEFGALDYLEILGGNLEGHAESVLWHKRFEPDQIFTLREKITLHLSAKIGYIRCRAISKSGQRRFMALTNAIYLGKEKNDRLSYDF